MRIVSVICVIFSLTAASSTAQDGGETAAGVDVIDVAKWPTDTVVMRDGRRLGGLIRYEDERIVELVEVGRKPRLPMYLLVRSIPRGEIAEIKWLDSAQRQELQRRIFWFRKRTKIAAALLRQIELTTRRLEGVEYRHYDGHWFTLDSTADEQLTREAIVRIAQMVAGFRTFIQPRHEPERPPRVVLLNTPEEYLAYQKRAERRIQHAAYFDVQRNEVIAGGELAALSNQLKEIKQYHQELLDRNDALDRQLQQRLTELANKLREAGHDEQKIRDVRVAARVEWSKLRTPQEAEIRKAERANDILFQDKFRVLYHEAFHAYLENYVFDKSKYNVPRWMNEGLAQVFENGLLDAGLLRLDAPDPTLLTSLQKELRGGEVLPLIELLTAPVQQFLVQHGNEARRSNRLYLYSWGLAYYLMFEGRVLDSQTLDQYLRVDSGIRDPIRRFEVMVGMPMGKFEAQWRTAMLEYRL